MKIILTALFSVLCSFNIYAQVFSASPNLVCAEGVSLQFNITTSGLPQSNGYYGFYEVCVTLNHPMASDVQLALESPAGTYAQLTLNNGGNANFSTACFRLYASNSIRYSNAPFSGVYMAYDHLMDFTNWQDPNGIWKLHYLDNTMNGVTGTLQNWSLNFITYPNDTAINLSNSNLPILKIDVPGVPVPYIPSGTKAPGTIKIINHSTGVNPFNSTVFDGNYAMGIELQGYTSSGGNKPNYDLEIRNVAGSDTSVPLLNMPAESDWILKSCYTDEFFMKDPLTFEMSNRMNYYAPHTRWVELMINDSYRGLYILEEKIKRSVNRVDIAKLQPTDTSGTEVTGGYIFEINPNGAPAAWYSNYLGYQGPNLTYPYEYKVVYPHQNALHPNQLNYIHSFVDSFEDALHGPNYQDPVNGWRRYASEKDFINFLIVSEYSTNYDTYGRSTYLYKEKSTDGDKIHCGPPWDADRGYCCDTGWVHIITHGYWIFPFWWQQLRTDSVFNKTLACRYTTLRNDVLTDAAFTSYIDSSQLVIRHAIQRNVNAWQSYVGDIAWLKSIVTARLVWMQTNLGGAVFPPLPLTTTTYCAGDPVDIFIGNQYTYNFQPGPDTSYFVPNTAGLYKAVITSPYGCVTKQQVTITPKPAPVILGNQYPCKNSSVVYHVAHIPGANYVWSVNGGAIVSGGGISDSSCTVQWGLPTFCMVRVKQSLTASCSDSAIHPITIQTCTSTNDMNESNQFIVFPSPVSKELHIVSDKKIHSSEIYDVSGRVVMRMNEEDHVDVSSLANGTYLIKMKDEDGQISLARFIKE